MKQCTCLTSSIEALKRHDNGIDRSQNSGHMLTKNIRTEGTSVDEEAEEGEDRVSEVLLAQYQ